MSSDRAATEAKADPPARAALPDARPVLAGDRVVGVRCTACRYPAALDRPRCPVCGAAVEPALFGPEGTVWSSTVVRVPLPGRETPFGLVYVDLDDGPRLLAHADPEPGPLPVGSRVRLRAGGGPAGDATVEPA